MKFANQPATQRTSRRRTHPPRNGPFWWPTVVLALLLPACVAVFMVTLASPNTETHSRPSPARLQADLKTLAAALRYVLESERDGVTALASNSAPVRQPLGEMSNSVAYTFPSNQPGLPGKILTNGSARS